MEKVSIGTYRKVAVTLWAVVSVVAGFTAGAMFDLSGRKMVFAVAVAVGIYILFIVRVYRSADVQLKKGIDEHNSGYDRQKVNSSEKMYSSSADYGQQVNNKRDEVDVGKVQKNDEEMTNEETREWLDKFLVRQQKGEEVKLESEEGKNY